MRWEFEPGHSAAEFRARHMMVTWVRGHFKNIRGTLSFDPALPAGASVEVAIDARQLWTGEPDRDAHLKSADFLDVEHFPEIRFRSKRTEVSGPHAYRVTGDLTMRGITREVALDVTYFGQWETPYWQDGVNRGPVTRAGFEASTTVNRHDFKVSWNSSLDKGGIVVGDEIYITIDIEALPLDNSTAITP
jgi:polyisoprenoid-binding protein YceI